MRLDSKVEATSSSVRVLFLIEGECYGLVLIALCLAEDALRRRLNRVV